MVEFAIILPFMVLLIAGGIDLARSYFMGIEISNGASQAALYVATQDQNNSSATLPTSAQLKTQVIQAYGGTLLSCPSSDLSVSQAQNPSSTTSSFRETVTVTCKFQPLTALLPASITLNSSSASYVVEP